jgi:hypothetical protein
MEATTAEFYKTLLLFLYSAKMVDGNNGEFQPQPTTWNSSLGFKTVLSKSKVEALLHSEWLT